ncbi:hypothetical protein QE152_g27755 [Popillia japonica]|uniref:Uncharacterized protein n=1 Tax=Popillia japonica TaxID=7064 RepID=A0AAW1JKI9_POPJA
MTFTRKLNQIIYPYRIDSELLLREQVVRDLGVEFDSSLSFIPHVETVVRAHSAAIENVQRRFMKYLAYRSDGVYPPRGVDNADLLDRFQITPLESRIKTQLVSFSLTHNQLLGIDFRIYR